MANNVEKIKDALSIEEVIGQYVELKPAGASLKGKSPFSNERTPSFYVSPERGMYYCFSTNKGGDIFTFIQEVEGLDFKGALKMLANKAGVELEYEQGESKDDKDALFDILESVTQYYVSELDKNPDARTYLEERGITAKTIKEFRIGFAPDSWSGALDHLTQAGFAKVDIEKAGLIKEGDKGAYDRFRSRIMFPITDSVGRVVAFSGRIFGKEDDKTGKYINSPETPLYHKSRILYGYDRARQSIRKTNFAILVEGQMDLIATHQAGYTNTVALSGTALTPEHITLLGRMSKNLCIALDADNAGIASASKSARAALRSGFDVKIAALPEGADPADMIAKGEVEAWKNVIKESQHVIDFLLDHYRAQSKSERDFKLVATREVLPYVHDIPSEIDATHFIQRVAAQLNVTEEAVRQDLSKIKVTPVQQEESTPTQTVEEKEQLQAGDELVLLYLWQSQVAEPIIDVSGFKKQVEEVLTPVGFEALKEKLKDNSAAAFEFESLYDDEETLKAAINELLERIAAGNLRNELERVSEELRKAESTGNTKHIETLEKTYNELHNKLAQLPNHL